MTTPHDLVLFGASGYVGRLTAAHLARSAPAGASVALAGRSIQRLRAVRDGLGPAAADWSLLEVDVTDRVAVDALTGSTRVLLSTVGPYARWGLPVVQSCAERGVHYADLTGEVTFVIDSIAAAHQTAVGTGAAIVHSCGFDSVPSDLGVGLTAARATDDGEGSLAETVLHVRAMRGGLSGGTIDSLRGQLAAMGRDQAARRRALHPYALAEPVPGRPAPAGGVLRRDPISRRWGAPFPFGSYDRQVVLRSDFLQGRAYGPEFRYREVIDTGRGPLGAAVAAGVLAGTGALFGGLTLPLTRWLLDRALPQPGQGPSEHTRERGHFRIEVEATTSTGARYRTTFAAPYDPGYGATAILLGESGLALAFDEQPDRGGVLTPWVTFGPRLADRVRPHGFTVDTERLG